MKLLHAADLHIDSALRGLSRYEGAPVARLREATRRALTGLVDFCLEERVDAVLLAGDIYDGDWPDYSTGLFFAKEMSRLREASIPVYFVRGNHDAQNAMTRSLRLPDNVHELPTDRPATLVDEAIGLAVHGQGFATRAVTDDLARGYPPPRDGLFNVGLLHTALDGKRGHDPYAPCSVTTLVDMGYDYWALGHVHAREVVHEDPYVVFPGNLQGRHARETGPKGATLVRVEGRKVVELRHVPFDVVRWAHVEVDASGIRRPEDLVDAARLALERALEGAEGRLLAARVTFAGESACHGPLGSRLPHWESELRAAANDLGDAWIEKIVVATRPALDREALAARDDAFGRLARRIGALRADPEGLAALAAELDDLDRKLPPKAKEGADGLRLDDPEVLARALDEVEALLLGRLSIGGEDA